MSSKVCWVVSDKGKIGTEHQCIGLAEALGFNPEVKRLVSKGIWRYLPPRFWFKPLSGVKVEEGFLVPPWPDLIIGAGRLSVAPTAYIRRLSQARCKVIQLQNPRVNPNLFDAVVVPYHDHLEGKNVLRTEGALHRVTHERLAVEAQKIAPFVSHLPRPLVSVLIGGSNRCYQMTPETVRQMARRLKSLADRYQTGLAVTVSRRTEPENSYVLQEELRGSKTFLWTGEGENPYFGFLALADYLIVTCDSVSMTSEACFTGKPVYTYFFPGGSRKFNAFHHHFQKKGYTRPFADALESWSYAPLDEFNRITSSIRTLLAF
jgi:mitochondrial fission protein ELM1